MHPRHRSSGFTLIELMIVVAIIGILAAIAYPSYQNQVRTSRRADAKGALMELAQAMERNYSQSGRYDQTPGGAAYTVGSLPYQTTPRDSATAYYTINLVSAQQTFTLSAVPGNGQEADACGTLTLNQTGGKGAGGANSDCWAR